MDRKKSIHIFWTIFCDSKDFKTIINFVFSRYKFFNVFHVTRLYTMTLNRICVIESHSRYTVNKVYEICDTL